MKAAQPSGEVATQFDYTEYKGRLPEPLALELRSQLLTVMYIAGLTKEQIGQIVKCCSGRTIRRVLQHVTQDVPESFTERKRHPARPWSPFTLAVANLEAIVRTSTCEEEPPADPRPLTEPERRLLIKQYGESKNPDVIRFLKSL